MTSLKTKLQELFAATEDSPMQVEPWRCRHLRERDRDELFRAMWMFSARPDRDIIRRDRVLIVLCPRCWSMLADFAQLHG